MGAEGDYKRIEFFVFPVGCRRWVLRGVESYMLFVLLGDQGVAFWGSVGQSVTLNGKFRPPSLIGTDGHKAAFSALGSPGVW